MPLYVGDYLADTMHLTAEQHGAYLLLIMAYWRRGKPLPDIPSELARVARVAPSRWCQVWPKLSGFFEHRESHLWHRRVEVELQRSQQRSDAARNASAMRWQSKSQPQSQSEPQRETPRSEEPREIAPPSRIPRAPRASPIKNGWDSEFAEFWAAYPRHDDRKRAYAAYGKALKVAEHRIIVEGAQRYCQDLNREPQFTKQAATWLNAEAWNNGPLPGAGLDKSQIDRLVDEAFAREKANGHS